MIKATLCGTSDKGERFEWLLYLPGAGVNHDQEGGSPRVRPVHCTPGELTPTIVSNVNNSSAKFLLVGVCVRAIPFPYDRVSHGAVVLEFTENLRVQV